jgi:hypothetical protein
LAVSVELAADDHWVIVYGSFAELFMGIPKEPRPVKLFVALLSKYENLLASVERDLTGLFGSIDSSTRAVPWRLTDYYEKEMGADLLRKFVSFGPLISPERLPEIKLQTQDLEEKYCVKEETGGRRMNIDPGYLEAGKVVLASTKHAAHRIYLRSGIYGEVTLIFRSGAFEPLIHTYKDYFWPESLSFFSGLRSPYLSQLKKALEVISARSRN